MSESDQAGIRAAIQLYLDGARTGNVDLVKRAFHPQVLMSGYLQTQLLVGGPEPFYDAVTNTPAPGPEYKATIVRIDAAGPAASVVVEEGPYLGLQFTTYFHLLRIQSEWRIVSKTFSHL